MQISAGLLPFRHSGGLELLIAHPGGPFFARKDAGAWSVVKGLVEEGEERLAAARREFGEETGWQVPDVGMIDLGSVTLKSRKVVHAWAFEGDFDPDELEPGTFEMELRGRTQVFPEIDRVAWVSPGEARRLLNPAQVAFVDRLADAVGGGPIAGH